MFNFRGVTSSDDSSVIKKNDTVIAVMGLTGVGKSSFVNTAAGRSEVRIGDNLESQTRRVQPVRCQHPDGHRNIVLVDTPGFDNTRYSDSRTLKIVADWLKDTYQNRIKLSGLLYLHRITDVRMAGSLQRNMAVFKDLCGIDNLKNVILATTAWDELQDESVGHRREEQLLSGFWKDMISIGSRACRFDGTLKSAWEIIDLLDFKSSRHSRLAPLQLQKEMVDFRLAFEETTAAKTLLRSLAEESTRVQERRSRHHRIPCLASAHSSVPMARRCSETKTFLSGTTQWSMLASAGESWSNISYTSACPSVSGSGTTGRCSATHYRDLLQGAIKSLKLAHEIADLASVSALQGSIVTAIQIAEKIDKMGGLHHIISQMVDCCAWLLCEITHSAMESELPNKTKKILSSFHRKLKDLQNVVVNISKRVDACRFFLHDSDIEEIASCITLIRQIEVYLTVDDHQAITRLEDQLKELHTKPALRQCECGLPSIHEESWVNLEQSI